MEYDNLDALRNEWLTGEFGYPEEIAIAGVPYQRRHSSEQSFEDIIINGSKAYIVYQARAQHREQAREQGLNQWIVFIWGAEQDSNVRPYDIRSVAPQRFAAQGVRESQERIGDVAILKIFLPSGAGALKGKVDTGAEISSLHADEIKVMNGTVKFINKELSNNVISVPIAEKQAVKSADGGVEYRPVIELDIEINGKPVRRVMFNLNDRNHMEYPVLIGQNILEKTNFLIDPKMDDPEAGMKESDEWMEDEFMFPECEPLDINFEALNEEFNDLEPVTLNEEIDNAEELESVYKILQESNFTLSELIRFIQTDVSKVMEDKE